MSLSLPFAIQNIAVTGQTMVVMLANAPIHVDPLYSAGGSKNVVVIWGGTNDIAINGATPASVYANMTSYVAARHARGWKVIVPTMLSRNGFDTQKNSYNALILANSAGADGIANFTGTPLGCDGCYSNTTWFQSDGIHPTQAGVTTYEAPVISTAVNALP
jgi:lysophospholipase L1-like esterase